jgi:hypothetical protein
MPSTSVEKFCSDNCMKTYKEKERREVCPLAASA